MKVKKNYKTEKYYLNEYGDYLRFYGPAWTLHHMYLTLKGNDFTFVFISLTFNMDHDLSKTIDPKSLTFYNL